VKPCWNDFCIADDCDGLHHVDATGRSWTQARGTRYCPTCGGYSGCRHGSAVITLYDRAAS
jgi:hypothetical protein